MKIIVANWKMNVGTRESVALARGVLLAMRGKKVLPEVVACPPFVALSEMRKVVARSHVALGAQDVFWEENGAYTGEISPRMLVEAGVTHVIIGHSERRTHFGETDTMVQKKMRAALTHGLTPILCVGESKDQRVGGQANEVVAAQIASALTDMRPAHNARLFVAYEPVWAIGTGEAALPADAVAMHTQIREAVRGTHTFSDDAVSVLYGGSITAENAYSFLREREVDGLLVGGASVNLAEFTKILNHTVDAVEGQQEAGRNA